MRSTSIDSTRFMNPAGAPIRLTYAREGGAGTERAQAGAVIARRYELEYPLRAGLPGVLWQARELASDAPLTLQLLDPALGEDVDALASFFRQAEAASAVVGPHVIRILNYGVDAGLPFLALERLSGESLERRLLARGRLSPAELGGLIAQAARGLAAIHQRGLLHGRLDPGHVFLAREPQREKAQVLFGIDASVGESLSFVRKLSRQLRDEAGNDAGWWGPPVPLAWAPPQRSAAYQSPELVLGQTRVDERSDVWSLAVIAFEALTGISAFSGDSLGERLIQICNGSPHRAPPGTPLPEGFVAWFEKGVRKEPSRRFASALEMADALNALLEANAG